MDPVLYTQFYLCVEPKSDPKYILKRIIGIGTTNSNPVVRTGSNWDWLSVFEAESGFFC